MAYSVPTVTDLVAKYPEFAQVPVSVVESYLSEAATLDVDSSWIESTYAPAVKAKAAHEMALAGLGDTGEAAAQLAAGVTAIRSGNFQVSFSADAARRASDGGLQSTRYGREYRRLLRRNKAGPRVVVGGSFA